MRQPLSCEIHEVRFITGLVIPPSYKEAQLGLLFSGWHLLSPLTPKAQPGYAVGPSVHIRRHLGPIKEVV
jgi:hypothetical protein